MLEHDYAPGGSRPVDTRLLVVLSGCSGGGKSSLLREMQSRGYRTQPEPGRLIVKEQVQIGGDALPWADSRRFAELCISRAMYLYNTTEANGRPTLFDRSIIDNVLGLERSGFRIPAYLRTAISTYRYAGSVFLVPPWRELFVSDSERRHSFEEAVGEYDDLIAGYTQFGYKIVVVPPASVPERADFLEERIRV
jgi:predicted ATPase